MALIREWTFIGDADKIKETNSLYILRLPAMKDKDLIPFSCIDLRNVCNDIYFTMEICPERQKRLNPGKTNSLMRNNSCSCQICTRVIDAIKIIGQHVTTQKISSSVGHTLREETSVLEYNVILNFIRYKCTTNRFPTFTRKDLEPFLKAMYRKAVTVLKT